MAEAPVLVSNLDFRVPRLRPNRRTGADRAVRQRKRGHPNLLMHHLHTPPPPLRPKRTEINEKLEELVLLCLAKNPEDRFQTAGEILSFAGAAQLL